MTELVMLIKKSIQSTTEPLEELLQKGQRVDFRLDEPQWDDLEIGDTIEYWEDFSGWDTEPAPHARRAKATIIDMFRERSFVALMGRQDLATFFEDDDVQDTIQSLRCWWTEEKETHYGVLGLLVKLIPS